MNTFFTEKKFLFSNFLDKAIAGQNIRFSGIQLIFCISTLLKHSLPFTVAM
jgi:hypothetical protein